MSNARLYRELARRDRRAHERLAGLPSGLIQIEKEPECRPISAAIAWVIATLGMFVSSGLIALLLVRFTTQVCS
jgi:hypothetical protein